MFVCSGLRSRRVIIIKCGAASLLFDDMGMERPQSLGKCALFLNVSKCLILFPICEYPCPVVIRSQILLVIVSRFPGSWSRSLVTAVWHPSHSPDPDIDDRVTGVKHTSSKSFSSFYQYSATETLSSKYWLFTFLHYTDNLFTRTGYLFSCPQLSQSAAWAVSGWPMSGQDQE